MWPNRIFCHMGNRTHTLCTNCLTDIKQLLHTTIQSSVNNSIDKYIIYDLIENGAKNYMPQVTIEHIWWTINEHIHKELMIFIPIFYVKKITFEKIELMFQATLVTTLGIKIL